MTTEELKEILDELIAETDIEIAEFEVIDVVTARLKAIMTGRLRAYQHIRDMIEGAVLN